MQTQVSRSEAIHAPVVMFVYKRPLHTGSTLQALLQSNGCSQRSLVIYSDGPKRPEDREAVDAVRELIASFDWPGDRLIISREHNMGLAQSVITGLDEQFKKHDALIVLEDDITVSPDFLPYMDFYLDSLKNEVSVHAVSGFRYPNESTQAEPFFLPIACSWGWATWKRVWNAVERDAVELKAQLEVRADSSGLDFGSYPFRSMLEAQIDEKVDSWAIRFYVSMYLADGMVLYPPKSLVANKGFDSSGQHCEEDDYFSQVNADRLHDFPSLEPKLNEAIVRSFEASFQKEFGKDRSGIWHRAISRISGLILPGR